MAACQKSRARFSFNIFWISKFQCVSRICGQTLIGHQIQSFGARKKSFWIWIPYICIIDCVGLRQSWEPRNKYAVGNRVNAKQTIRLMIHFYAPNLLWIFLSNKYNYPISFIIQYWLSTSIWCPLRIMRKVVMDISSW